MVKRIFPIIVAVSLFAVSQAHAVVVTGDITGGGADATGSFINLGPSFSGSVGEDTFQDNNLYAFDEDQNIVIPFSLDSDVGTDPLPAGTEVASHYVFFDPDDTTRVIGYVDFDADIYSIMTSTDNLADSDFLINNSVTYLNPSLRGLEPRADSVEIDPLNSKRILIDFTASTPGDYIRVLTQHSPIAETRAIPEPASLLLFGSAMAGAFIRRRW